MPRHAVKDRFNIDVAGGQAPVTSYPEIPDNCPLSRKPPGIPECCLPAGLREFAPLCTGPKWLTEGAFLPSTIRHQY